jgi:hypothetical protein
VTDPLNFSEELVSRVAQAIYGSQVNEARKTVAEQDLGLERIRAAFETAIIEADRSAAILVFALAEDLMLSGLRRNMNDNVAGGWKAHAEGNGVLATASDRIAILELLWWIKSHTAADLRLLKAIRNRFAHHADVGSFGDTKISGWVSTLSDCESVLKRVLPQKALQKFSPRELFLMRSAGVIVRLAAELAIGPVARSLRVEPRDVEGPTFDQSLDNLRDAERLSAEIMLKFVDQGSLASNDVETTAK